ncbi:MAG: hypothetical protein ABEJ92_03430 [Halobacteriales archaeon]
MTERDTQRYDRLPATAAERLLEARPTREGVVEFFADRYGVARATFDGHTFWEKGADSVWAVAGEEPDPIAVETLGLRLLRTGGHDWKPTTDGVQRFGDAAGRNVIRLDRAAARRFVAGDDQVVDWDGDRGYLIVATDVAGDRAPLGVGLFVDGTLRSQVPKARRVDVG